ncbi:unnamed protein product [Coregonus sp. 'balchen']|nr:unnamed protein product [Coregonus sp. 'balchen']
MDMLSSLIGFLLAICLTLGVRGDKAPEPSQRIVLNFNPHFELERLDCRYDFIEIRDGGSDSAELLGKHCSNIAPPAIISSGTALHIKFVSDYAHQGAGFSLRYEIFKTVGPLIGRYCGTKIPPEIKSSSAFHCSTAFGLESGKISDDQISASSSFYDGRWSPRQARLNNIDNAWTPSEDSGKEYIQLEVSTNGEDWMTYRYGKNHKTFHANTDPSEVVLNRVPQPVLARFMQGLLSGQLPDTQISASSARDMLWSPGNARLVASRSGWFPGPAQPLAGEEWLQVDLGVPKTVRGIITQGARGGEGTSSTDNRAFVRKYRVAHSLDGKDWGFVMDSKTSLPKIFEGNTHYDTPELRRFEETLAQFIRIYPERWSPAGIGMRVEILGCDVPETSTLADTATPTLSGPMESSTAQRSGRAPRSIGPSTAAPKPQPRAPAWTSLCPPPANTKTEQQRARILSPVVGPDTGPLCLLFSYQLWGEAQGTLHVLLRDAHHEETLLWALRGDQGPVWKEGRTILPRSPKETLRCLPS